LTVISGYTEILLRRLGREGEASKEIAEVSKAAARAARLTRQLLAYSRKQVLEPRVLQLNGVITETRSMLERVISENIEFSTRVAEEEIGNVLVVQLEFVIDRFANGRAVSSEALGDSANRLQSRDRA
jgi:signal transduction histidine kinase